ncbi:MAG: glycine--tRNA ligase subunit beta [Armatimonadetes bacterium]|nr:glycine--tRNA ligase subunit beta [Armatimonadota bacterium]
MLELLLEVGCEELPATFVERAFKDLEEAVLTRLEAAKLLTPGYTSRSLGTPRRLIVSVNDIIERQEDEEKEVRGPALKAAHDANGAPTPALLGFCKSSGVTPESLRKDEQYVWAKKHIAGRPAGEILAEILPEAIRSLSFDKTMRWGGGRMRFARPIRWILASLGGKHIPFEVEGLASGLSSQGHRFYDPEAFEVSTFADLESELRGRKVEPDPEQRREEISQQTAKVAGGRAVVTEALLDENVYLTEWPTAIVGSFKSEFMELPDIVLETAMAKHEKMFPVRGEDGKLTNQFVFIRNSGEDETVRRGAEWVLNARFNDAKFFFDEDKKFTLEEFLEKTEGMLFQEGLGSIRLRAERLEKLAREVAMATGADEEESNHAARAGRLCKADLSSGLVSELASLQGKVGGEYARRENLPDPVCWAMFSHYDLSLNPNPSCAGGRTAVRVLIADQLDKLAGFLGMGLQPSGSSDPFGLRRAATLLIEAAWQWPGEMPSYHDLFKGASKHYFGQQIELKTPDSVDKLVEIFASRYAALADEIRHDILEAAILKSDAVEALDPQAVKFRCKALTRLAEFIPFVQTATRPLNIIEAARKKGISIPEDDPLKAVNKGDLGSATGEKLLEHLNGVASKIDAAAQTRDIDELCQLLQGLTNPVNLFFEETMVMAEEEKARAARLALVNAARKCFLRAGDFSKIVIEG